MSRRLITLAILGALVAAPAADARVLGPQEESGNILLPSPGPSGGDTCWQGFPRRFYMFSMGQTSGPMGSVFEIDKTTWGGKFKLEVTSGQMGSEDLDMHFFVDIGHIDPADPAQQSVVASSSYTERKPGGEVGTVPPESKHVIICIVPGTGVNADWTYKALPPKKTKK